MGWSADKYRQIRNRGDLDVCFYCHVTLTDEIRTIDHVIPLSKGGPNDLWNLCLACTDCNRSKGDDDVLTFLTRLRKQRAGIVAHNPMRKPKKAKKPAVMTPEHEDARQRILDVKRSLDPREQMTRNP